MAKIKNVFELSDEEIEDCIDGSSNVDMIREILAKDGVVDEDGLIDSEEFSDWFAYGLEGYIDAEEDSVEWQEAYDNNRNWGQDIADNINNYISEELKE